MIADRVRFSPSPCGERVSIENGRLGMPSTSSRMYAVNLGNAIRSRGVRSPPNWSANRSASDAPPGTPVSFPRYQRPPPASAHPFERDIDWRW